MAPDHTNSLPCRTGRAACTFPLRVVCLVLGLSAALSPISAAGIYRWTDDQGQTHYSEIVPEKYLKTARLLAPASSNPTEAQQHDAQERAAVLKSRASAIVSAAPRPQSARPPSLPGSAAPTPVAKRPAQLPDDDTDCETWARLYRESLECFGPYRTAGGAMREEAYAHCNPVDAAPSRCRQPLPDPAEQGLPGTGRDTGPSR